jgi:hypothetical protein
MPKIIQIKGFYEGDHIEHILGEQAAEPREDWKRIQRVPLVEGQPWFNAYPMTGGAVIVQQHRIVEVREATLDDLEKVKLCMPFNPAYQRVLALFQAEAPA